MPDKKTELSIKITTVDAATAKIKAINERLDAVTKPARDFKSALSGLAEKTGLNDVISGFKGVGSAVEGALSKLAVIGGVAGLAVHEVFGLVKEFDELGDTAERIGVTAQFLSDMRYAAEQAGAPVEALDSGLQTFNVNLGKARLGMGRMATLVAKIKTDRDADFGGKLLQKLKAAKDEAAGIDAIAEAMSRLADPADRATLATAAFGDAALAPLLAKGPKAIKALVAEHGKLAPGMDAAAEGAGKVDEALHKMHAAIDGAKGALITGLSPALTVIVDKLTLWFTGHQKEIADWAENVGKKLPGAVEKLAKWLEKAYDKVTAFVDAIGGIENAAILAGAILAGPLIGSVLTLTGALFKAITNAAKLGKVMGAIPSGVGGAGGAAAGGVGAALGPIAGALLVAEGLNEATGGSLPSDFMQQSRNYLLPSGTAERDPTLRRGLGGAERAIVSGRPDVSDQARSASGFGGSIAAIVAQSIAAAKTRDSAKITIDITGAQRGTKVTTDPTSSADVDLSVGYQMGMGF